MAFSEAARTEAVAGKTAETTIKVLSIQANQVPELSDELAEELGFEGGAEGMTAAIRGDLTTRRDLLARNQARANLLDPIGGETTAKALFFSGKVLLALGKDGAKDASARADGYFDTVEARTIWVKSDAGEYVVALGASDYGGGAIQVYNKTGKIIVHMHEDEYGNGVVGAWNRKGKGRTLTPGP